MSNLICKDCKSTDVTAYTPGIFGESRHKCKSCGKIGVTANFVESSLFNRITQSPEALAETYMFNHDGKVFKSLLLPNMVFNSREEAYTATVEKLRRVVDAEN